jgi:hypothetical protein|tara:strand:+ start:1296 stop:1559 length:264 start_codon:yes stop_codon:yes gene_type:complete
MRIEKKLWPKRFEQVLNGIKRSDIRLADFEVKPGDLLLLREWDPEKEDYTGRIIEKEISSVIKTKDLEVGSNEDINKFGFQILSFRE